MISLDCHHPDLLDFLNIKKDLNKVTKANISVRLTDDFMEAVKNNDMFTLSFTREETNETIEQKVNARELFMVLAQNNWEMAEPGCLFWDRISKYNLLQHNKDFSYAGVNPCAEEPLPAGGSCLLGSLNLAAFVNDGIFDFEDFAKAVQIAVIGLNNVLDEGLPLHPLQEQRESVANWRQIGLGIMGLADALIKMQITYGSPESIAICNNIGYILAATAIKTSNELAARIGAFKNCNAKEIMHSDFFKENTPADVNAIIKNGLANSQLLTIAPTGSLSTMIGVSGGIEPIFANSYTRKTESLHGEDVYYKVYTPIIQEYMDAHSLTDESELPPWFVTAPQLDYHQRIDMQSVWQKHIDASISSTVNVGNDFSVEDTAKMYIYAWQKGLKGLTMYRDGCARTGILTTSEEAKEEINELKRGEIIPTSDNLVGLKKKLITGCGSLHCEVFFDEDNGEMREVYLSKGSTGGCNNFMIGLSRMISLAARAGVSIDDIIDQLMSTGTCPSYASRKATKKDTSPGSCCPMAIGYALKELQEKFYYLYGIGPAPTDVRAENKHKDVCPECGAPLVFEGGCNICKKCGWTKCD